MAKRVGAVLLSLIAIVLAGVIAAVAAWSIVAALGLAGVAGALLTVFVAMIFALVLFGAGVKLLRAFEDRR